MVQLSNEAYLYPPRCFQHREITTHKTHGSYISNNSHKAQNGTIITQSRRELVRTAHKTWYNRIAIHAGELFKEEIAKLAQDVADGEPSADGSIDMAVAAVWRIARRYQHEKIAKHVAEKQAEPTGTKKLLRFLPLKKRRGSDS